MAMFEEATIGELTVDTIIGGGVNLSRRAIYLDPTNGSDGNGRGRSVGKGLKTLANARLQIATGRNDAIILVQGTSGLSLAADPLWSENMSRIIGNAPGGYAGMRSRIGMSAAFTPMMTFSGYGNLIKSIYFQHGYGSGHVGHQGILLSGNYTVMDGCHISSPLETGIVAATDYEGGLTITGTGFQTIKNTTIGNLSIDRTGAAPLVTLGPGTCTLFKDCIFMTKIGGTGPFFFSIQNTTGLGQAFFQNCKFLAMSTNRLYEMAYAFTFTGGSTFMVHLDTQCSFAGVTRVVADAYTDYVWMGRTFPSSADEFNLIAKNGAIA